MTGGPWGGSEEGAEPAGWEGRGAGGQFGGAVTTAAVAGLCPRRRRGDTPPGPASAFTPFSTSPGSPLPTGGLCGPGQLCSRFGADVLCLWRGLGGGGPAHSGDFTKFPQKRRAEGSRGRGAGGPRREATERRVSGRADTGALSILYGNTERPV